MNLEKCYETNDFTSYLPSEWLRYLKHISKLKLYAKTPYKKSRNRKKNNETINKAPQKIT